MASKQKQLDLEFFFSINKKKIEKMPRESLQICIQDWRRNMRMPKRRSSFKRLVRRPRKEKVAELLQPTSILVKPTANSRKKVIGLYQNWFNPILWPPSFTTVKQHRNIQEALDFLKYACRQPCDLSCVYDHLNRSIMNRWILIVF